MIATDRSDSCLTVIRPRLSVGLPGRRLDQFGEDSTAVLRVQERDARAHGTPAGLVVQHPDTVPGDAVGLLLDVAVGAERDVVHALAVLGQELGDGRVVANRFDQLQIGRSAVAGVVDLQHRLADALLLVDLLVDVGEAVRPAVELDGRVQVMAGDADVVDPGEHPSLLLHVGRGTARRPGRYPGRKTVRFLWVSWQTSPRTLVRGPLTCR